MVNEKVKIVENYVNIMIIVFIILVKIKINLACNNIKVLISLVFID